MTDELEICVECGRRVGATAQDTGMCWKCVWDPAWQEDSRVADIL